MRIRSLSLSAPLAMSRAAERASATITSASRRACARMSSAIRSADTQRVAKRLLELLLAGELALELLELVAQVGALAPDVLEARGHVGKKLVDAVRS